MFNENKIGLSVVNYNSSEKVIEAIDRIVKYHTIDNIVITDNGSKDNSWKNLQQLNKYNNVKLFHSFENKGLSYGLNICCKYLNEQCNVDYILVMTPATYFTEECLIRLIDALIKHKEYALIAPVNKDEHGNPTKFRIAWHRFSYKEHLLSSFALFRKYYYNKSRYYITDKSIDGIIPVDVVGGALYLIDAKVLGSIRYYDEEIFLYNEENVLSAKLAANKYKLGIHTETEYFHSAAYSVKKSLTNVQRYKYCLDSQYIYVKKYLKVSSIKLFFLKIASDYSLLEKKIIELIRTVIRK